MRERLVPILACPECLGRLEVRARVRAGDEIAEGELACPCGREYPVRGGIPRFVPDDAYVGSFSFQWNLHARTQFDTPDRQESRETFHRKTGLGEEDLRGKVVLDVGCGSGRFLDVLERMGAAECVGIDLSLATEAAWRNLGDRGAVHVIQADVFRLPFRPGTFDTIYSIGVLHHTPDTRSAFLRLPGLLKPGGRIAIWVYEAYSTGQKINALWRRLTTRLPARVLYPLCAIAVPLHYPKKIPFVGTFLQLLLPTSDHPDWRWRWLDTFDWYSPVYQWHHRYPEVAGWFREAGLSEIEVLEPPVSVRGRRP